MFCFLLFTPPQKNRQNNSNKDNKPLFLSYYWVLPQKESIKMLKKRESCSFQATEHPTSIVAGDHICRNWNDRCCQWNWRGLGSIVVVWLNDDQMKYRWLSLTEDVFTLELFKKKKKATWSQHGLAVFLMYVFHFDIISWTAVRIMLIVPSGNIHLKGLFIIWFLSI